MIDPDIAKASALPADAYVSEEAYARVRESVLAASWHVLLHRDQISDPGLYPATLGAGSLDEPVIVSRAPDGALSCFSNVCTHRGAILLESPCPAQNIRCRYHGRRFDRAGRFLSMPELEGAADFPSERDHLPALGLGAWGPLIFGAIAPTLDFDRWIGPVRERLPALDLERARFTGERVYELDASWALYCDNYLEGFHIPYVHPELAGALDYASYSVETFEHASLQIGVAKDPGEAFDGGTAAAYYFFLFPTTMLNVYPWGLSLNIVEPLGPARTRVRFLSFVTDERRLGHSASANLDLVERQDEAVVCSVQRGVRSRLYRPGRYSPSREIAVHHFHRLLEGYLSSAR